MRSRTRGSLVPLAAALIGTACGSSQSTVAPSTEPTLQAVTLAANVASLTSVGQTVQATATGRFSDGTTQDISSRCTNWQSDALAVLTVSGTGLLTAQGNGSATITATCLAVSARGLLTVALRPTPPTTFTLTGTVSDSYLGGILPNVAIQITEGANARKSTTTDASGNYSITGLSPGTLTVSFSAISYFTTTKSLIASADMRLDVVLQRDPRPITPGQYRLAIQPQVTYDPGGPGPRCSPGGDPRGLMLIDGQLVSDARTVRFTMHGTNDLVLQLSLTGNAWSGTILSTDSAATMPSFAPPASFVHVGIARFGNGALPPNPEPAVTSAVVIPTSAANGTFNGYIRADYSTFNPMYNCGGAFTWTLRPR